MNNQKEETAEVVALKEEGDKSCSAGDYKKALEIYGNVLSFQTDDSETHFKAIKIINDNPSVGQSVAEFNEKYASLPLVQSYAVRVQALMMEGQHEDGIGHCKVLCDLIPDNAEVWMMLGMLNVSAGRKQEAVKALAKSLDTDSANPICRNYFLNTLLFIDIDFFDEEAKCWVERFLKDPDTVDVRALGQLWLKIMVLDPDYVLVKEAIDKKNYEEFSGFMNEQGDKVLEAMSSEYFLIGLRQLLVPRIEYELFLTNLRRWLLDLEKKQTGTPPLFLSVALAGQCFNNEYVFFETDEEKDLVEDLEKRMREAVSGDLFSLSVLTCYRPLYRIPDAGKRFCGWLGKTQQQFEAIDDLIQQQIIEPREEKKIRGKLSSLREIDDSVSRKVRAQYEEHPYPRWIHIGHIEAGGEQNEASVLVADKPVEVLVAGCATGFQPIGISRKFPLARLTGIDLSLSSLSYASRKAKAYGVNKKIDFVHGDLLFLGDLKKQFDYIDCLGVLHHMKEPEQGWAVLRDVLKEDGVMKIGLYSETARRYIVMCQDYIKENNIPGTDEGIKQFRKFVMDLPAEHDFKNIFKYIDFYTTSMCRDLLFHVQEHRFTISGLQASLASLDLEFLGFAALPPYARTEYMKMFPDDPGMQNIENWGVFEETFPDTFIGMYVFLCGKRKN